MTAEVTAEVLLLVDTCGERGSVALVRVGRLMAEADLPERAASAGLLQAVGDVLAAGQVSLRDLTGVGVVSGPGSFTGVRVGMAVCKGICEATGVHVAAVSRLEVLADAAGLRDGLAVLRAGRDQVYVRSVREGLGVYERLVEPASLAEQVNDGEIACAEATLLPVLQSIGANVRYVELSARAAANPVRRCLARGGSDLAGMDANYVRAEEAIYARIQQGR